MSQDIVRVGIDLTGIWRRPTGIFRYAAELANHLLKLEQDAATPTIRYVLFFAREVHPDFRSLSAQFDAVVCPTTNELLIKQFWFPLILPRLHLNVMHYPSFPPPFIRLFGPPTVMTLHDAGPWRYAQALTMHGRLYFRTLLARGSRTCAHIITVSKHAKSEIAYFLGARCAAKCSIIPEAARPAFALTCEGAFLQEVRTRFDLPARFLFTVSTVEPRKNLVTLLDAYARLKARLGHTCPPLVIVGRKGWNCDDILRYMTELEGSVRFPGHVSDEELVALYQLATCLVFPSLYEGFGLPVLEAMMAGCPVITSSTSSLPEVAADASLLVDPLDADALASAMQRVLQEQALQAHLSAQGRIRAATFTWEKTAQLTRAVYLQTARNASFLLPQE